MIARMSFQNLVQLNLLNSENEMSNVQFNSFNASWSKLLLFEGFSAILV